MLKSFDWNLEQVILCCSIFLNFNSFRVKLKFKWLDPFNVARVFENRVVELTSGDGLKFKINEQTSKLYFIDISCVRMIDMVYLVDV